MSLKLRLLLLSSALILIPLLIVGWMVVSYLQTDKEAFVQLLGTETTPLVAEEVSANLEAVASQLSGIAEVATAPYLSAKSRSIGAEAAFKRSGLIAIAVFMNGKLALRLENEAVRNSKQGAILLSELPSSPTALRTGETQVHNATRIESRPVARLDLAPTLSVGVLHISGLFDASWVLRPSAASTLETWVVDHENQVLVSLDPSRVAAKEACGALPPVIALRAGRTGSVNYRRKGSKDTLIGAYAPSSIGGAGVVQDLPKASIAGAVRSLGRKVAATTVGAVLVALLIAFGVSRSVARPLELLGEAAEQIGNGQLDATLPSVGSSEVRGLIGAFSKMQAGLAERDRKLQDAQEALIQSEKMGALGQLAAGITHEVKNPLAGILGYAQLAQKLVPADSPVASHLATIEKESRRAKNILQNLLTFARKETGERKPVDPNVLMSDALSLVSHPLQLARVNCELQTTEDLPAVLVDSTAMQQVMLNLCMNAADAMKPKGGRLLLSTKLAPDGRVVIAVKDEGHGISDANRKKLFTPFFTTKAKGEGTGLGLSVSYGIVKANQGELRVWSQEGVGTVFYLYLPPLPPAATA